MNTKFLTSSLIICLALQFSSISYALSRTESFQLYVTIPPHVSTAADELNALRHQAISTDMETPTLLVTEQRLEHNQPIIFQSVVVR